MSKLNIRDRNKGKLDAQGKKRPPNWEYRFEIAKVEGKRKSISKSGFRTKKEAEVAGAEAMAKYYNGGLKSNPSDMSYADFLDFWYNSYVVSNLKPNTQNAYSIIINRHLKPALGMYKLKSLTPIQLQEYVNTKFATGLKKTTLTNITSVITASLKYAVVPAQLIPSSPAMYIKYPSVSEERLDRQRYIISTDDLDRIIDRFPGYNPFRIAIMIGYYTGLRISEVYGLTWDDIDLKEGYIDVNKQIIKIKDTDVSSPGGQVASSHWYITSTKTQHSIRRIKIGATLIGELKKYKKHQLEYQMLYGELYTHISVVIGLNKNGNQTKRLQEIPSNLSDSLSTSNFIMRKENGQYSSTDSFKYAARVIHYDLGIKFNFHSLRHTHATILIDNGVSPKAVQARLGHADIQTTLQTYVHDTDHMDESAVDIFERVTAAKQA